MTEVLKPDVRPYQVLTTAHITYPLSRRYNLPVAYEGHLRKESTKLLVSLFRLYAPKILELEEGEISE